MVIGALCKVLNLFSPEVFLNDNYIINVEIHVIISSLQNRFNQSKGLIT